MVKQVFGIHDFWIFVISGIVLNITPGPDSLYILGRSVSQGFRAGSAAALGIVTGTLVHIVGAAFGLSAILTTSAIAFTMVKTLGCLYLCYLGISMLIHKKSYISINSTAQKKLPLLQIFYQGFLTNILNPKVALFFLAFVPQFICDETTNAPLAFILLGIVFNINSMIYCHLLAWFSSSLRLKIPPNIFSANAFTKVVGIFFLGFGIKLFFSEQY